MRELVLHELDVARASIRETGDSDVPATLLGVCVCRGAR